MFMSSNEFGQRADYIVASALGKVWVNTRGQIDLIQEKSRPPHADTPIS